MHGIFCVLLRGRVLLATPRTRVLLSCSYGPMVWRGGNVDGLITCWTNRCTRQCYRRVQHLHVPPYITDPDPGISARFMHVACMTHMHLPTPHASLIARCRRSGPANGVAALRTLEESRANLAAIQAVAHRPSSLPGSGRGPRSSSLRSRSAARYTLDEAAVILKSLPAVPEGEPHTSPPGADDGTAQRPAGMDRFLSDLQQFPAPARQTAAEEEDYRRTVARRMQDQAHQNLLQRTAQRSSAYPSLQPSSQDSVCSRYGGADVHNPNQPLNFARLHRFRSTRSLAVHCATELRLLVR